MSNPRPIDADDEVAGAAVVLRLSDDGFRHAVAVFAQIRHAAAQAESDAAALSPEHRSDWRKSPLLREVLKRRQQKRAVLRCARHWLVSRAMDSWAPCGEGN